MWLWVMIVVVKTLNHHQMIHFCVDAMIATNTSMSGYKMIYQILDHAKRNMMGSIVVTKVTKIYKRLKKNVLATCIIKISIENHILLLFSLCVLKQQVLFFTLI
jgi:uncharacterized protein with PIN domain